MLQHRVLLLLVAALAVTCLARPTHHVPKIEKDLEEIENDVDDAADNENDDDNADAADDLDAEEEVEITVQECLAEKTPSDLLAALDAGSSGTKMFLYASDRSHCPKAPTSSFGSCKETFVKFVPTMNKVSTEEWEKAFSGDPSRVHRCTDLADTAVANQVKFVMAFATAGNRIIPTDRNVTAWNSLVTQIGKYNIRFVGKPQTIPGTHEAFLEYKASQKLSFVSMGGASAQAGFNLDSAPKWNNWKELVMSPLHGDLKLPVCNNQDEASHFTTAILKGATTYTPIPVSGYDESCKDEFKCVGLVSWLGGPKVGHTEANCKTLVSYPTESDPVETHLVGGNDRAQVLLNNEGEDTRAHCFEGPLNAKACVAGMESFSKRDLTMQKVRSFVSAVKELSGSFAINIIASLQPAVKIYSRYNTESFEKAFVADGELDLEEAIKIKGTARFAAWGVHGILIPLGFLGGETSSPPYHFTAAGLLSFADANWIASEAAEAGFPVPCPVHFKPEVYLDGTAVGPLACVSYLNKDIA